MSNNINIIVKNYFNADEDGVHMIKNVHEWVSKGADLGNMYLLNEESVLKCFC